MTFAIREIRSADNPQIAGIIRQVLAEFGANCSGFVWADPELDHLSQAYTAPNAIYYVVTVADNVVGGGGIAPFPCIHKEVCELQKMYLLPSLRGQGVGKDLMQKLLATAVAYQYQGCYLETFHKMHAAMHLYQKFGFEPVDKPLGNSGHSGCDRFFIRWFDR
ncbi:MAG: GNAT family N-acetyltransferase [Cyanobacteria bacterium P01_H01_bin.153]